MRLAISGHRPKYTGGYSQANEDKLYALAHDELRRIKPSEVGLGMAIGWDQAVAQACVDLSIPFVTFVPFSGQEKVWPRLAQLRYHQLLDRAHEVRVVCPGGYSPAKMAIRNHAMVDWSHAALVLFNGQSEGGTWNFVKYAKHQGKPIHNCWASFLGGPRQKEIEL